MKSKPANRICRWMIPALAIVAAGSPPHLTFAADAKTPTARPARAPKSKSKTQNGTIAAASATQIKLTTKAGEMTSNLVATTEYYRVNEDIPVAELKTGDVVKLPLRGTNGLPTVQSLAPLTLKFGDKATLTFNNTAKMKFDRVTKIAATDLAAGQTAKVANRVFPDGKIEAREVWVSVAAPKTAKTAKKP